MSGNGRLSARQQKAIAALLSGGTVARAAKLCDLSERQLYRWLDLAEFRAALDKASADAVQATARQLSDAASIAVIALRGVLTDSGAPVSARVRAADVVLGRLVTLKELVELEARILTLENIVRGEKDKGQNELPKTA